MKIPCEPCMTTLAQQHAIEEATCRSCAGGPMRALFRHLPFTIGGGVVGVVLFALWSDLTGESAPSGSVFWGAHVVHVLLSAAATSGVLRALRASMPTWSVLAIGVLASLGMVTLSDCGIPGAGLAALGFSSHDHVHASVIDHPGLLGVLAGVALLGGWFGARHRRGSLTHSGHVLVSTAASLAHLHLGATGEVSALALAGLAGLLVVSVWLPCWLSDVGLPVVISKLPWWRGG